jgi:flagellar biosynthesis protein FlhA
MVSTEVRLALRRFLEPSFPKLVVLAFQELPSATEVENAGVIQIPAHLARADVALKAAA